MSNISVAEILKIHGKWIKSSPFVDFVAEKKRVTERQAYTLIKKAVKNNEIMKITLQNRTVLYGLPEFGAPQTEKEVTEKPSRLGFWDKRAERKQREKIQRLKLETELPLLGLELIGKRDNVPEILDFVKQFRKDLFENRVPDLEELAERLKRKSSS